MEIKKEFYKELSIIKKKLDESKNPFFFFDDDPDGVCAFLQLYKYKREGDWQLIKSSPNLTKQYSNKVNPLNDKVFILDKPLVDDAFLESMNNYDIVWVDHHEPQDKKGITYVNPRKYNQNLPTSLITYMSVKESLWIAAVGTIGDWFLPPFMDELTKTYPDLISRDVKSPEHALFSTQLGKISKIISFNLKGKSNQIKKSILSLIRVKDPYEILYDNTSAGNYLLKRFNQVNEEFEFHLKKGNASRKGNLLVYTYQSKISFTQDLANELLYLNPNCFVVVGRESKGFLRLSFRSSKYNLLELLPKVFSGLDGGSGGHEHACGGHIKTEQFEELINRLKKAIS